MNSIKVYSHPRCGTCKKALKFLDNNQIIYTITSLEEESVSKNEIEQALKNYDIKKLFNTSGQEYRKKDLKTALITMTLEQKIKLLLESGLLIKRPFLVHPKQILVGFKQDEWEKLLN